MLPMCEGPKVAANNIFWEGLIALIALIHLWECATSLIMLIVIHKFVKPVRVYLSYLTLKQVFSVLHQSMTFPDLLINGKWLGSCQKRNQIG